MLKRIRGKRKLLLLFAVLVAIAFGWRLAPRSGLLAHAVLLVPRSQWVGPEQRNGDVANYVWLTKEEVLLFQHVPGGPITLLRKRVVPPGKAEVAVPIPMPPLNPAMGVTLSPGGETLNVLYKKKIPRVSQSEFIALQDGHSYGMLPQWVFGTWYEGQPCVCECVYDKQGMVATLRYFDGRKDKEITIEGAKDVPVMEGNVWPLFIEPSGRTVAIGDSYYDGVVTPVTRASVGNKLSPVRTLVEFNLNEPHKRASVWTVPVPSDAASFFCTVSPQHDRILWTVQSNRMPLLPTLTQHLPRPFRRPARYLCRWMVSDLDGRNMHPIAEFEISDLYFRRPDLLTPQWNPDGKHISFEYEGALYWLPAD